MYHQSRPIATSPHIVAITQYLQSVSDPREALRQNAKQFCQILNIPLEPEDGDENNDAYNILELVFQQWLRAPHQLASSNIDPQPTESVLSPSRTSVYNNISSTSNAPTSIQEPIEYHSSRQHHHRPYRCDYIQQFQPNDKDPYSSFELPLDANSSLLNPTTNSSTTQSVHRAQRVIQYPTSTRIVSKTATTQPVSSTSLQPEVSDQSLRTSSITTQNEEQSMQRSCEDHKLVSSDNKENNEGTEKSCEGTQKPYSNEVESIQAAAECNRTTAKDGDGAKSGCNNTELVNAKEEDKEEIGEVSSNSYSEVEDDSGIVSSACDKHSSTQFDDMSPIDIKDGIELINDTEMTSTAVPSRDLDEEPEGKEDDLQLTEEEIDDNGDTIIEEKERHSGITESLTPSGSLLQLEFEQLLESLTLDQKVELLKGVHQCVEELKSTAELLKTCDIRTAEDRLSLFKAEVMDFLTSAPPSIFLFLGASMLQSFPSIQPTISLQTICYKCSTSELSLPSSTMKSRFTQGLNNSTSIEKLRHLLFIKLAEGLRTAGLTEKQYTENIVETATEAERLTPSSNESSEDESEKPFTIRRSKRHIPSHPNVIDTHLAKRQKLFDSDLPWEPSTNSKQPRDQSESSTGDTAGVSQAITNISYLVPLLSGLCSNDPSLTVEVSNILNPRIGTRSFAQHVPMGMRTRRQRTRRPTNTDLLLSSISIGSNQQRTRSAVQPSVNKTVSNRDNELLRMPDHIITKSGAILPPSDSVLYLSKVVGVVWDKIHNSWVVNYTLLGRRYFQHFPAKKFGFLEGRKLAIELRLAKDREKSMVEGTVRGGGRKAQGPTWETVNAPKRRRRRRKMEDGIGESEDLNDVICNPDELMGNADLTLTNNKEGSNNSIAEGMTGGIEFENDQQSVGRRKNCEFRAETTETNLMNFEDGPSGKDTGSLQVPSTDLEQSSKQTSTGSTHQSSNLSSGSLTSAMCGLQSGAITPSVFLKQGSVSTTVPAAFTETKEHSKSSNIQSKPQSMSSTPPQNGLNGTSQDVKTSNTITASPAVTSPSNSGQVQSTTEHPSVIQGNSTSTQPATRVPTVLMPLQGNATNPVLRVPVMDHAAAMMAAAGLLQPLSIVQQQPSLATHAQLQHHLLSQQHAASVALDSQLHSHHIPTGFQTATPSTSSTSAQSNLSSRNLIHSNSHHHFPSLLHQHPQLIYNFNQLGPHQHLGTSTPQYQ